MDMRPIALACAALFLLVPAPVFACQILSGAEQAAKDAANLARERLLAADTARRADAIFVGRAERVVSGREADALSTFLISERLKGGSRDTATLSGSSASPRVLSCDSADMFNEGVVVRDGVYLVYADGDRILRARRIQGDASIGSLSLEEERAIVAAALASHAK